MSLPQTFALLLLGLLVLIFTMQPQTIAPSADRELMPQDGMLVAVHEHGVTAQPLHWMKSAEAPIPRPASRWPLKGNRWY